MNSEAPGKQSVTEECVLGKPSQISGIEKTFLGKDKKKLGKIERVCHSWRTYKKHFEIKDC